MCVCGGEGERKENGRIGIIVCLSENQVRSKNDRKLKDENFFERTRTVYLRFQNITSASLSTSTKIKV